MYNLATISIWGSAQENLFSGFANNKGADQTAQSDQRLLFSLVEKYNYPNLHYTKFQYSS